MLRLFLSTTPVALAIQKGRTNLVKVSCKTSSLLLIKLCFHPLISISLSSCRIPSEYCNFNLHHSMRHSVGHSVPLSWTHTHLLCTWRFRIHGEIPSRLRWSNAIQDPWELEATSKQHLDTYVPQINLSGYGSMPCVSINVIFRKRTPKSRHGPCLQERPRSPCMAWT
jgi:hypothetical protein